MDFHNMKRKQLQALCIEHNIPANLTNVEMANKLSSLLKGKEAKHVTGGRSCLKRVEVENEIESESDIVNKKVKKVRFSPENETFEFVKSDVKFRENRRGGRRASVLSKVSLADEILENVIDTGRVTRSSGKKLEEGSVVETKKGRKGEKSDGKGEGKVLDEVNVDVVHVDEGGGRVNTRRSLRNKAIIEEVKRENVGAEISKGKGKVFGESNVDVANVDEGAGRVNTRRSLRNKVVTDEQKGENVGLDFGKRRGKTRNLDQGNAKDVKEVLENDKVVEDEKVESQKVLRRSKRNAKEAEDSTMLGANGNENEVAGKGRTRRTKKSVVNEACEVETLSKIETEVNAEERAQPVVQVDEPENFALRRSTRRKSVIPSLKKNSKGEVVREKENILDLEEVPKVQLGRGNRQKSVKPAVESVGNDVRSRRQSSELLKQSREPRRSKEELQIGDNLRRSKRNAANYETLTTTEGKNGNLNAAGKKEPSKRRRNQNVEEEAAETGADKVERVPQQSSAEPRVSPAVPNQPLEQRVRDDKPVTLNNPFTIAKKVSFLVKGSSDKCHEEPPAQDDHVDLQNVAERGANAASCNLEIVMDNIAESSATQHLSNAKGVMESTIGDIEKSSQKAHQENHDSHDRTSAGTCDIEEVKGLEFAKLEDGSPMMTVDVSTDHLDVEMAEKVDIWLEINIDKSPEKYILDNEESQKCQSASSVKDFTCSHLVEPQCATATHPSSLAVDQVHEDGGVSIHKELMLEPESTQRFTPPVIMDNTIEDSGDANENAFEKDEEAGDQDEDEKEYSASGRVNEEKGISAKKEHLHKPEDNIYVCPVSSDHVDEGLLDDSCQSMGLGEKSGNSCRKDGEADAIASRGRDSVTSDTEKKIHEEDPGKPEEARGELITETDSVSELPQSEHIVEPSNTEDFEADKIAQGDGVSGYKEQIIAELVEYDEAECLKDSLDERGSPNVHDPSLRSSKDMLWNTKTNDSGTSANRQRSMSVSPDVAAKFSQGMITESVFSSSSFRLMHLSPPKAKSVLEHQDNEIALGTVVGKANSPNIGVQKQDAGIEIGSEVKGEIHSMEVEVPEMERKPTTVQKDGLLGSNSCVKVGIIMDDSDGRPVTEKMGDNHNSISMCEDMREKENHESCLGEESQLLETLPSSSATSGAAPGMVADVRPLIHTPVKDSCQEEQGELLRNLFATPLGVIKMREGKENFSSDSERTGEASKKAINLAEDGRSSDNKKENFSSDCERTGEASKKKVISLAEGGGNSYKEASNEDLQDARIEIGSEVKGEIHSMEVEVPEMERKPTTVQKDGLLGSNSCVKVGIIMDDSDGRPVTEKMGDNHNSISMCEDMREKENHESCLGEESQLLETLPSSSATSGAAPGVVADVRPLIHTPVKDSCQEEQGELLRNLFATPLGVIKMREEKENFSSDSERTGEALKKAISLAEDGRSSDNKKENFSSDCERTGEASKKKVISLAEGGGNSYKEASNEDLQDAGIEIGSEVKGEIHSMEVEVPEMERKPTTVQKDGLLGSNSCVKVGIIMDDSDGRPVTEKMGDNHNSISMCEDMREKENHESCLGEESQLLETLTSSSATSGAPGVVADVRPLIHTPVKDSCQEEQGELLRNLFATPLGVIKMTEEKENFSSDSKRTGEASKKAISLAEDGRSSDNKKENFSSDCERTGEASKKKVISLAEGGGNSYKEASNEDLQGEQLRNLFATPFSVSKTTEGKECFSCDSEKADEASNIELLNVCNSSPSNNKETCDGNSSKFCPENEARNLLSTPVDSTMSEMKNETSNHGAEMTELPMSLAKTVAKVGSGEVIPEKGREYKKCTMEKTVLLTHDQVLNGSPGVAWPEDQLRLLFATPVQSMANYKEGETLRCETLSVTSSNDKVLKQFRPQELLGEVECGSEKVVENSSALSSDDANIINEFLDEAKGDVAVNISTSTILCEGFSESYEVSKKQMTADLEATAGIVTGMKFIKEEKNEDRILSSGTISPNKDATDHHSKFIETIPVTSVNDLNEAGQSYVKMSHDNMVANLRERNSDVLPMETFDKSEARISCSRETASTSSVQEEQPDIHVDVPEVELNTEEKEMKAIFSANETYCTYGSGIGSLGSVDCKDQVWDDVGDAALPEDDEVRMESDGNVAGRANAECHIRSSEALEEQATNIEEAQGKDDFVGVSSSQELVMHISGVQQDMIKACGSPYGVCDTVPLSKDEPAAVDPESQLFSFEMNVIPAENEDHEIGTQPSSSNTLCHSSKEAEEIKQSLNLIREQLVVSELQVKGEDADSRSNFFGVLDSSVSEGHEVLKESEVAATIKEYIDSETNKNLSVSVNNSGVVNHIEAMTNAVEMNVTQHANFLEPQCGIHVKPSNGAGEIDKPSSEEEPDGRKDTMERKEASSDLVTSRGFIAKETSTLKRLDATAEEGNKLFAMQRKSTAKSSRLHSNQLGEKTENVRTILIHGTPRKADMKENAPASKAERKGCLTTVRPAKRRALEDLPWR